MNVFNCTYDWLVSWEFVPKVEHEQHESDEPEQLFAHSCPGNQSGRGVHAVPD